LKLFYLKYDEKKERTSWFALSIYSILDIKSTEVHCAETVALALLNAAAVVAVNAA